jgi:hypothetical protein
MPRINSFSSIGPYLSYQSSVTSGLANGWSSISTNRYTGITGTFSNTSYSGQIITIGSDANSSTTLTNTARIINRHKSNGNIYWSVNYPANTWISTAAGAVSVERYETNIKDVPDSSQNVYIGVTHASSSSDSNRRANIIKITPSGTIAFQKQIAYSTAQNFNVADLKADYLGVTFVSNETQNIFRFNNNGTLIYQKLYTQPSGHDSGFIRGCEAFDNVSWFTADSRQYSNTFYSQVFSLNSSGNILWKNQLGIGIGKNLITDAMCVDSDKNLYLVGRENSSGTSTGFAIKLSNTGSLSWAKSFSNTNLSTVTYSKKDDAIYSTGTDTRNSSIQVITKLYSNGDIEYAKTLQYSGGSLSTYSFSDREGYIYLASRDYILKVKSDGSETGSYASSNTITYSNVSLSDITVTNILSSITNTASAATLTNSTLSVTTPTISLSTVTFSDTIQQNNITKRSYSITPDATSVNEGSNVVFYVTTSGVPNNTTLYYTISGTVSAEDFTNNSLSGSFVISSNNGTFILSLKSDGSLGEGSETFNVNVRINSITGNIVATSTTITVNDTSTSGQATFQNITTSVGPIAADYPTKTFSWTAPAGVTSVSVVCIGGGGGGYYSTTGSTSHGGGGGGLAYRNNIPVTPGQSYNVVVGARGSARVAASSSSSSIGDLIADSGGNSYFNTASTVIAYGGRSGREGRTGGSGGGTGATFYTGGTGGLGQATRQSGGGGGAAGYSGNGGNGGNYTGTGSAGATNSGAAAGGSGATYSSTNSSNGGGGGGVRPDGKGLTGNSPSQGGSSNTSSANGSTGIYGNGGYYGGGGAGVANGTGTRTTYSYIEGSGGAGVVKIIWPGDVRQFPSTRTADE